MKVDRSEKAAFTLVELLVVMAIIAILVALLIPAIVRAKQKAQQTGCVANLHQHGIALQNFVAENHAYPSLYGPTNSDNPGFWVRQLSTGGLQDARPLREIIARP